MFRGINAVNLDAKGRLAIPARYRLGLDSMARGHLVVTIDTEDTCLLMYPLPIWEEIERRVQALPALNAAVRRVQRLLIGHATEVEIDGNGRILLPSLLREYAQSDKKVMLVGMANKFELWSESTWEAQRDRWLATKDEGELPPELMSIIL